MTKRELEEIKEEYDLMKAKEETKKIIDRMVTINEVEKIKSYAEKIYNQSIAGDWAFLYGMRDNIHDMTDNLADEQNWEQLQFFNTFMYGVLLDQEPNAVKNLHTLTGGMKEIFFENAKKVGVLL